MKNEMWDQFLEEQKNKARGQWQQDIEDFMSDKRRREYPYPLTEPLYVDPKKWGPEPDRGKVHKRLPKAQRRYRQKIHDDWNLRLKWFLAFTGIDADEVGSAIPWKDLCCKLVERHVPGLGTTHTPPPPPSKTWVTASLAIVEAVDRLRSPDGRPLAARVGIATGLVVVGDLLGTGAAQEEAVVGDTPNLAARLQVLAGSGEVVVAEQTRRLIGGLFEVEDLGPCELRGFGEPINAWRISRTGAAESRFEALHTAGLSPLVARVSRNWDFSTSAGTSPRAARVR